MYKLVIFSIAALIFTSCGDIASEKYFPLPELNRVVKSVKFTTYEAESKFGDIVFGDFVMMSVIESNSTGNIKTIYDYSEAGDLSYKVEFKYDSDGRPIEILDYEFTIDGEETPVGKVINEYLNGYLSKSTSYYYSYYDNHYKPELSYVFIREGDKLLEQRSYENRKLCEVIRFLKNDKTGYKCISYDGDGNEINKVTVVFNNDGDVVERRDSETISKIEYNKNNLPVYLENIDFGVTVGFGYEPVSNKKLYIEYEYDQKGNWIRRTIYSGEDKTPDRITVREIEY